MHAGHRNRMRDRFAGDGECRFYTYELLEMLLYYVIPQKDTNPISKSLLDRFGSLKGVLQASEEELRQVDGVGAQAASLIKAVNELMNVYLLGSDSTTGVYRSVDEMSELCVDFFKQEKKCNVLLLLFDGRMRLLDTVKINSAFFGSGGLHPSVFVKEALEHNASVAIIAYTNRSSLLFPMQCDIVATEVIKNELMAIGVDLAEVFLICGDNRVAITKKFSFCAPTPHPFLRKCEEEKQDDPFAEFGFLQMQAASAVYDVLSYAINPIQARTFTLKLVNDFRDVETILTVGFDRFAIDKYPQESAQILRLSAVIISRALSEFYRFGRKHTEMENARYLSALYLSAAVETVYMLIMDESGKITDLVYLGDGTVNASDIYPRKIAERAKARGAASVIIAHNHPSAGAKPSDDDIQVTHSLSQFLHQLGVKLDAHYVVAGRICTVIRFDGDDYSTEIFEISSERLK